MTWLFPYTMLDDQDNPAYGLYMQAYQNDPITNWYTMCGKHESRVVSCHGRICRCRAPSVVGVDLFSHWLLIILLLLVAVQRN